MQKKTLRIPKKKFWLSIFTTLKRLTNERRRKTMPQAKHITRVTPYASSADFRRVFDEDMSSLYLLSFLLTADHEKAEQCFVSGLDDAVKGNPVFREWARSWARRAIILNAVRVIKPRPEDESGSGPNSSVLNSNNKALSDEKQREIAPVLGLEPFERFVYVITVLERYSDQECSVVLGCKRRDIPAVRIRAFQQIARSMESHYKQLPNARAENPALLERPGSVLQLLVAPRLATSS
jgi:hypothetical protein